MPQARYRLSSPDIFNPITQEYGDAISVYSDEDLERRVRLMKRDGLRFYVQAYGAPAKNLPEIADDITDERGGYWRTTARQGIAWFLVGVAGLLVLLTAHLRGMPGDAVLIVTILSGIALVTLARDVLKVVRETRRSWK